MPAIHSYETGVLTAGAMFLFKKQFNKIIGTETETSVHALGEYTVMCFELTMEEVEKCRNFEENALIGECTV
jgi:hypothetical protein